MRMHNTSEKIRIAVSSCLLGYDVRYDGGNRKNDSVLKLADVFDLIAICPEYGIGMGIPRAPINIINVDDQFRALGVSDPGVDVTGSLQQLATNIVRTHKDLCGYVFKARSPSCGLESTPWFDNTGQHQGITSGIFSQKIRQLVPDLPMIEETQLENDDATQAFIERVKYFSNR